jgi:hypothetical protein
MSDSFDRRIQVVTGVLGDIEFAGLTAEAHARRRDNRPHALRPADEASVGSA